MTDQTRYCPYCGAKLDPAWAFCEFCGKPVTPLPPAAPVAPEPAQPVQAAPAPIPPERAVPVPTPPVQAAPPALPAQALPRAAAPTPPPASKETLPWPGYVEAPVPPAAPKKKSKLWIVFLVVGLLVLCCLAAILTAYFTRDQWLPEDLTGLLATPTTPVSQPLPPTAVPPATAIPAQPGRTVVQYQDDFSRSNNLWNTFDDSDAYSGFNEGGVYAIAVKVPQMEIFAYPDLNADRTLDDVTVNVSAFQVEGAGDWGIMCRYVDLDNFYRVAIDDGAFAIYKLINNEVTFLTEPDWIDSNELDPAGYNNGQIPISLTCKGSNIHFEVNGFTMYDVSDTDLPQGNFRIYAGSYDTVGDVEGYYNKMLFDNFSVIAP